MPISQMRSGLTAENSIFSQKPSISVPRSRFDLGRPFYATGSVGMIIPVDVIPTLPNDDFELSAQYQLDFRPMLVPSFTAYKVKLHYYYCPNEYLWSGWESFITKGRSGKLALTVPTISLDQLSDNSSGSFPKFSDIDDFFGFDGVSDYYPYSPMSLAGYISRCVPYASTFENKEDVNDHFLPFALGSNTVKATGFRKPPVNALPYLMYQKIYRSNYIDPNLMANGTVESDAWFPDDIDSSHWRFSYSADNLFGTYKNYFMPQNEQAPSVGSEKANFVPKPNTVGQTDGDNCVNLLHLRYAMYTDDMFTTALPFLQRGPQQTLDLDVSQALISGTIDSSLSADMSPYIPAEGQNAYLYLRSTSAVGRLGVSDNDNIVGTDGDSSSASSFNPSAFYIAVGRTLTSGTSVPFVFNSSDPRSAAVSGSITPNLTISQISASFTAQKLRELLALSVWQERNALTNGSYGQFIKVHFDKYPNNQWCEPIYIGGTTSYFNTSSILQTSASSSGSTPQGNPAGVSGTSKTESIGRFHFDDFGFIMVLLMVIPDTTYMQTTERWELDISPDDYYMPEYERLSYQPILNKQIFYSGNSETDNGLFGYSNRYVYLKQRDGVSAGYIGLPASVDAYYHSYVQTREFSETPKLSQNFVTAYPPNLDRSFLASPGEPDFFIQFYSGVRAVRALSYASQPNTFGF